MWPSYVKNPNPKQNKNNNTYLPNTHAHKYTHASSFTHKKMLILI